MAKVLALTLGLTTPKAQLEAVFACLILTLAYNAVSGMWAVLWTDLIQFVIKMSAVIILAVYSVRAVGGITVMKAKLIQHFGSETAALSVMPVSVTVKPRSRSRAHHHH